MKKQKFSRRDVLKGSLALGTVFASPVRAEAPPAEAITPQLIEAAKKEAKVVLYSAMDLPVGEKLGKAFEAQYPGIAVQIERSGSERLFQRIDQEFASGIRVCDVVNSADASHFIPWKRNGWLAPFVSEDIARHFPSQYRDPDGGLHGAIFTMPVGTAEVIKKELVAQGAHTTATGDSTPAANSSTSPNKEKKQ